jgi:hypothetical protein
MPLVTGSGKVTIPFDAESYKMIRESEKVVAELERVKSRVQTNGKILEDQAKREAAAVQKSTMSWTDFRSMYQTVLDVVRVGQAVWDETGQKFADYAIEVGQAARTLGSTTEEASRLIQVADDVGISFDALKTSMKLAQKDGFEPNIEGLARMSDEYLKLAPGVERTQYLLDRFGKSGDEMAKIMEKGGKSIREMSAAIDDNLIVTEEGFKQAEQYRVAVDELNDAWDGFTMQIGQKTVPVMTDLLTASKKNIDAGWDWKDALDGIPLVNLYHRIHDLRQAHDENTAALAEAEQVAGEATGAFEDEAEMTKRLAEEQKAAEQAIKAMTEANRNELSVLENITGIIETYKDKQADLKKEHDELTAKKAQLIKYGWWAESDAVLDVNAKLAENAQKQQENADQFQDATNRRILSRAEELLSIDGLTNEEKNGLIERGLAMGVYTQEAAARMREEESAAQSLASSLNSIPNVERTVTITTNHVNTYTSGPNYNPYASQSGPATPHASGGVFEIPSSYGNEGFRMGGSDTASGREKLAIAQEGQNFFGRKEARMIAEELARELRRG